MEFRFLEFLQKNTLFGKTNDSMFHFSLRVIDEPKMSEIKFWTCADRGSIFTESRSSSFTIEFLSLVVGSFSRPCINYCKFYSEEYPLPAVRGLATYIQIAHK